jgi:hypothetical protein
MGTFQTIVGIAQKGAKLNYNGKREKIPGEIWCKRDANAKVRRHEAMMVTRATTP